jgi:NADH:ubiquinone oxidoreductase subunit 5 (subunit L)/multisubunit Na+/H+ antiporter MnhA subunit
MMWIGTVALIGFWPFSKDEVLAAALQKGGITAILVWVGGLIGALFTGIYATRLMRLTFYGERSQYASEHLHSGHGEAPWTMFFTVAVLAAGTLLVGFLEIGFGFSNTFFEWLGSAAPSIEPSTAKDLVTTGLAWVAGGGAALLTWRAYASPALLARIKRPFAAVAVAAEHKFYWDEAYDRIAYLPAAALATALYRFFERWVIWGTVDLVAYLVRMLARVTTSAQTGVVRQYATVLVAGAAVLGVYFLSKATL